MTTLFLPFTISSCDESSIFWSPKNRVLSPIRSVYWPKRCIKLEEELFKGSPAQMVYRLNRSCWKPRSEETCMTSLQHSKRWSENNCIGCILRAIRAGYKRSLQAPLNICDDLVEFNSAFDVQVLIWIWSTTLLVGGEILQVMFSHSYVKTYSDKIEHGNKSFMSPGQPLRAQCVPNRD